MKAIKKTVVGALAAVSILLGSLFGAAPAMAYTDYTQYNYYVLGSCHWNGVNQNVRSVTYYKWRDYDWWEETFYGYHDQYVFWYGYQISC